jgi:hypothetical protein
MFLLKLTVKQMRKVDIKISHEDAGALDLGVVRGPRPLTGGWWESFRSLFRVFFFSILFWDGETTVKLE